MDQEKYQSLTSLIVWSICSVYYNKADDMYLRFENEFIPLLQFFETLVPRLGSICWPFDKEEIGRIWHHLYVIPESVDFVPMPEPNTMFRCEELPLQCDGFPKMVPTDPTWCPPINNTRAFQEDFGSHGNPSSEVTISTFHTLWFLSTESFFKRVSVIRDAAVTRLFVDKSPFHRNSTSYHLTWIPHLHMQATKLQKRSADDGRSILSEPKQVLRPTMQNSSFVQLNALVWNLRRTEGPRFTEMLVDVVATHQPMMVILTGTTGYRTFPVHSTQALGFTEYLFVDADPGQCNGVWIFWKPTQLEVHTHEYYASGKHLTVKVKSALQADGAPKVNGILKVKGRK